MLLLLRDLFVNDSGDELLLGQGIPARWLAPGSVFGVENLPTRHGPISYRATIAPDGKADLQIQTTAPYRLLFPSR